MQTPTREIYWNIADYYILYILFVVALVIFTFGFYRRYRLWRLGTGENRIDQPGKRALSLLKDGLAQASVLKDRTPGYMHIAIYSGFVVLFIGTLLVFVQADFSINILFGEFYLWYSLILDLFGLVFLLGLFYAIIRRYLVRPERLSRLADDGVLLSLLVVIGATGFVVEGTRIAATEAVWAAWSPIGNIVAGWFSNMPVDTVEDTHRYLWWFHLIISMGFIAYIPYSKLFHIFTSPANLFFKSLKPRGQISTIDMENAETFGVTDINEFTWKQLFDLDACTHCGRCQDQCPAYATEKPLSPKKLILDLQEHLTKRGHVLLEKKKKDEQIEPESCVDAAVSADEIWSCTTCRGCEEHCPVSIEHVQKIVDLRRARVMMESRFPQELNTAFRGLETNANPWGVGHSARTDWTEGLNVPLMSDVHEVEYLWFVGCAGAFDDRGKGISTSLAKILNHAGVSYGIPGLEEKCCGDPARRSGNEYVFQMMAEENVRTINQYKFKKILTSCPHGYHMLKNEYCQFGGNFEVVHHAELIVELINQGKLSYEKKGLGKLTYHDSCYMGRYNGLYSAPRNVLDSLSKEKMVELTRTRNKSFCCGAGGARMFMEENLGTRINHSRVDDVVARGADTVGVACPFCLTMLDDGLKEKGLDEKIKVYDIAQMVVKQLGL